jgi:adenylosuccinate synthase
VGPRAKSTFNLPTHRLLDAASGRPKGKARLVLLCCIGPIHGQPGRNGIRGDIELERFKERYRALADKHEAMIAFHDVNSYNLAELERENFFESIDELKKLDFIDSEEYMHQAQKQVNLFYVKGAQGSLLDVDFGNIHLTSSNTTAVELYRFRYCNQTKSKKYTE